MNIWFFIANPRIANWKDSEKWDKHKEKYNWGIPNNSRDIDKLMKINNKDIILCYTAIKKELVGCCKCLLPCYSGDLDKEDVDPEYINRIGISKIHRLDNPIKLFELKSMSYAPKREVSIFLGVVSVS